MTHSIGARETSRPGNVLSLYRRYPHHIRSAIPQIRAGPRLQVFRHAEGNGRQIIVAAAHGHLLGAEFWIGLHKLSLHLLRRNREVLMRSDKTLGYFYRPECTSEKLKIILCVQSAAGSVREPLMIDQPGIRHDVRHLLRIRQARSSRTVLGISVDELRPQSVHNKAVMSRLALGLVRMRVAELRRPRNGEQIIIEHSRCSLARLPRIVLFRVRRRDYGSQQDDKNGSRARLPHAHAFSRQPNDSTKR